MAWSLIEATAAASVSSGNLALTASTLAAQGDLYVATIAYGGVEDFTLPSGWSLGVLEDHGDAVDVNAGKRSVLIAYIVHGASAPDLTFVRTGGNVARGGIVVYRSSAGGTITLGTNKTQGTQSAQAATLSLTGFTTEAANALLVFGVGTSQITSSTFSGWAAATDPTAASWAEHYDTSTSAGVDVRLGAATAVKSTAGATGTLSVTSASATGFIAGAVVAFYENSLGAVALSQGSASQSFAIGSSGDVDSVVAGSESATVAGFGDAADAGVTATASAARTLAFTIAQAGSVPVGASAASTPAAMAQSADAAGVASASAAKTFAIARAADASTVVQGSAAKTLTITQLATGLDNQQVTLEASAAQTVPRVTRSASGSVPAQASADKTFAIAQSAPGTVTVAATASRAVADFAQTSSAVSEPGGTAAQVIVVGRAAGGVVEIQGGSDQPTLVFVSRARGGNTLRRPVTLRGSATTVRLLGHPSRKTLRGVHPRQPE